MLKNAVSSIRRIITVLIILYVILLLIGGIGHFLNPSLTPSITLDECGIFSTRTPEECIQIRRISGVFYHGRKIIYSLLFLLVIWKLIPWVISVLRKNNPVR